MTEQVHERRRRLAAQRRRLLLECIAAYGGRCQCCGEDEPAFLTIDHVNRRKGGEPKGVHMYRALRQRKWPKNGYRLMCFNCNLGRERAGRDRTCPHESQE